MLKSVSLLWLMAFKYSNHCCCPGYLIIWQTQTFNVKDGGSTCFPIIHNFLAFVFPCSCTTQEKSEKSSQWNLAHTHNNAITTQRTRLVCSLAIVVCLGHSQTIFYFVCDLCNIAPILVGRKRFYNWPCCDTAWAGLSPGCRRCSSWWRWPSWC